MPEVVHKLVNGVLMELTDDELAARETARVNADADINIMRHPRGDYLAMTDKTQLADYPLGDHTAAEWATYRQELRDMMATPGLKNSNVVWPKSPIVIAAGQAAYDAEVAKEGSGPVAGEEARTAHEEMAGYPGPGLP